MGMSESTKKLPTRTKAAFGFGSLAFGIKDQGFNTLLMLYYNQVIGLPATWVGLTILVATLVDAITDPVVGQLSDHHKSRLGRRHPFMYASALPVAVGYLLFWAPPDAAPAFQCAWLLVTSIVVRVGIGVFEVPSAALMAEFTNDYDERTSLSIWRSVFLALGLVGGGMVALKVFLKPTPEQPLGQLNAAGYEQYGICAALVMFAAILIATRGTQSQVPKLNPPKPRVTGENLLSNLKLLLVDRAYISVVACIFFFAVAGGITSTLGIYVSTYFWKLTAAQLGALAGAAGLGAILGLAASSLAGRFGKRNLTIGAFAVALISSLLLVSLKLTGVIDIEGEAAVPYLMIQTMVVSATVAVGLVMGGSMLADVADRIEFKTGRRMEGLMFAAMIMTQKSVSGMGVFLSGMVLSVIAFPEKADPATIDPAIITDLATVYVLSLGVLVTLALVAVSFYPITRESHDRTVAALRGVSVTTT
jgi:glycoside/pentoside/hexuronide:cation symporter, GPH family